MTRIPSFATFLALALAAAPALARRAGAPDAPAAATRSGPTVVVVADAFDDETENARLRARVYELCRQRGLTPDGKADVRGAAEQRGAVQEGRLVAEPAPLDGVRQAVGAAVLIRIARDAGGVRVLVVKDGDGKSESVASADAAVEAVGRLLGGAAKAPPAAAASPAPHDEPAGQGLSAGFVLRHRRKDDEPDYGDPKVLAQAWRDRGGVRVSYGAHAQAIGLMIPRWRYVGQNPETGLLEQGEKTAYGVGLGLGLDLSVMILPLPEPASGSTSWTAARAGLRLDVSGLYVRPPQEYTYKVDPTSGAVTSRDTKYDNAAWIYGVLPFELGVHLGFGDFRSPTLWRGVALGLAYAPAVIFSLKAGEKEDDVESVFNYGGFELSADIVKVEAAEGSQPQVRLSALVLPRVNEDVPWLTLLGVGAVWY